MSQTPPPRTIRLLTALLLVAVFALGTLTGGSLVYWSSGRWQPRHGPRVPPFGPWSLSELNLSKQQEREVFEVFEKHRPELDAILREGFPKVRSINEAIEREVRALLTPEQLERFDARADEYRDDRPGPFPPGRPGPPGFERPPFPE